MTAEPAVRTVTPEEYLAAERRADRRHELLEGVVVAMAGGSLVHGFLIGNMTALLRPLVAPRGCMVGASDIKVRIPAAASYFYPDIVVVCGEPQTEDEHKDVLLNPSVIVEILSPSTEGYDRGAKAERYRAIPSLHTLVFVAQDRYSVHWYEREGDTWVLHEALGAEALVTLSHVDATISLANIYENIRLPLRPLPPEAT